MLQALELLILRPVGLVLGAACFVPFFALVLAYAFWPWPSWYRLQDTWRRAVA